jgi:bifunctional DNA-binding transcriptional regulator/antitoxin component of YhaV-PrlF toxin-antitoxin module
MRLLSQTSRKYKGKEYKKFWAIIPSSLIDKLKWKTGDELKADVKGNKLIVEKE